MPRPPRIVIPGLPLHLIQRGVNRAPLFLDEPDFRCFLRALLWASKRSECLIHAYVLMTNHVHVLLTPNQVMGPARMMKSIGALFVQYINKRYDRTGVFWERRYRSSVVDSERYLLACSRYIELNPVRAELVSHPSQYPWSSYHCNAAGKTDSLITSHPAYRALGGTDATRRLAYRTLLEQREDQCELQELRAAARSGAVLQSTPGPEGVQSGIPPRSGAVPGQGPVPAVQQLALSGKD